MHIFFIEVRKIFYGFSDPFYPVKMYNGKPIIWPASFHYSLYYYSPHGLKIKI